MSSARCHQLGRSDDCVQEESSFQTALRMMSEPHESSPRPQYQSDNVIMRLSVKLFDCTPARLPPNLKEQLTGWLQCTPLGVEGYLRPGCVHLLIQASVPAQEAARVSFHSYRALNASACKAALPMPLKYLSW